MEFRQSAVVWVIVAIILFISIPVLGSEGAVPVAARSGAENWGGIEILDRTIEPGEKKGFSFLPIRSFESEYVDTYVLVARGDMPGPTLCVTAGIHGDEINGVEIARRCFKAVSAKGLHGTLIVLPAINRHGFLTRERYMPDRQDLNRFFPGDPKGNISSILAYAVFSKVVRRCDALIDLHTASFYRANLPQIRVDLTNERAVEIARHFGIGIIVGKAGPKKTLRREAMAIGIPAVIYESGEPNRFQVEEIERGLEGVLNVMAYLGMLDRPQKEIRNELIFSSTKWVRVPPGKGGIFFPVCELSARVLKGDLLGTVTDPWTDDLHEIRAPFDGVVIGMSIPQVVLSGFILFDIGLAGSVAP